MHRRCSLLAATPSPTAPTMWLTPWVRCDPAPSPALPWPSPALHAHPVPSGAPLAGPFAAIYGVWDCTCVSSKTSVPIWILIMGGVGIVLGLATYGARACAHCRAVLGCHHPATHLKPPRAARFLHSGYKIMRVLGVKMTRLTNSRGEAGLCCLLLLRCLIACADRTILPAPWCRLLRGAGCRYRHHCGQPLRSAPVHHPLHGERSRRSAAGAACWSGLCVDCTLRCVLAQVGAVTGIGLVETVSGRIPEGSKARTKAAFNWFLLLKFFFGWVATLIVAGLTTAAFTAQGIYAPNKNDTNERITTAEVRAPHAGGLAPRPPAMQCNAPPDTCLPVCVCRS